MKKALKWLFVPFIAICLAFSLVLAACNSNEPEPTPDPDTPVTPDPDDTDTPVTEETYRFEAEDATLWADESNLYYTLENTDQGSYVESFVFNVQDDEECSGNVTCPDGGSVGYLSGSNPTITFTITSDTAVTGATISIKAASMDLELAEDSSILGSTATAIYALALASINPYVGSEHNLMTVNSTAVTLSETLPGSDSVFNTSGGLNIHNWGTLTATIDLVQGENTITLTLDDCGLNIDYIEITAAANLSWTATDNNGFSNTTNNPTNIPSDETPDEPEDNVTPDEPEDSGEVTITKTEEDYNRYVMLEADDAGLFDAVGKIDKTTAGLLKIENLTGRTGTDADGNSLTFTDGSTIGNFNTSGDKIVFCAYASEDIEDVLLTITAGTAIMSGISKLANYEAASHQILTVNGETAGLAGTIIADSNASLSTIISGAAYAASWGTLQAEISLTKGINYITFTSDGSGLNLEGIKLCYNTETTTSTSDDEGATEVVTDNTTVESISIASKITTITTILDAAEDDETPDTNGTATIEAEEGYLINATGKENKTTSGLLKVEEQSNRTGTGDGDDAESLTFEDGSSVGNFNTSGDMVILAVYSDAEVEVSITITAGTAIMSGISKLADYDAESHQVLSVNGTAATLSGTVKADPNASLSTIISGTAYAASWGYLTATVTLKAGVNYIVFTCDGSGLNLDCLALSWTCTVNSADTEA
ncbi:MAG: hypothetical protein LUD51_05985 [Clostridia bacterium]|nr:hypothetical protein [Clostridia bacterium]